MATSWRAAAALACALLVSVTGAAALAPVYSVGPSGTLNKGVVKLGFLTGTFARAIEHGAKMALLDASKNLLPNYKLELYTIDTLCDDRNAVEAVKKFAALGVTAILGDSCSGSSIAAKDEAAKAGLVVVSAAASSDKLSIAGDNFLRVVPPDRHQGKALAEIVAAAVGSDAAPVVAVVVSPTPYGLGLQARFTEELKKQPKASAAKVLPAVTITPTNAQAAAKAVADAKPAQVLLATNNNTWAGEFIAALGKAGFTGSIVGSDSLGDEAVARDIVKAGGDTRALARTSVLAFNQGDRAFKDAYQASAPPGLPFVGAAVQSYDAVTAVLRAFKDQYSASANDGRGKVSAAQVAAQAFEGKGGPVKFDAAGDAVPHPKSYERLRFAQAGKADRRAGTIIPWVLLPQGFAGGA